ncbi:MAG: BrnA antitoxin of type toxin-antitoxin system, partial [Pseudomonadota bacterium]
MAKTLISIRLEPDILGWYKAHAGDVGYQSRISSVLRNFQKQTMLR